MRDEAVERFPTLAQFFGAYLHEDWDMDGPTPQHAVDAAIADHPVDLRRQVRRELAGLLASAGDDTRLRDILNDGLGVNVYFREPGEARAFAEEVERKLLASIRDEYGHRRDFEQ